MSLLKVAGRLPVKAFPSAILKGRGRGEKEREYTEKGKEGGGRVRKAALQHEKRPLSQRAEAGSMPCEVAGKSIGARHYH